MSWKRLRRTAIAALAALTLAAASPAAGQTARSRPLGSVLERLAAALRQRLVSLWTPRPEKGCEACAEQGPATEPPGETTTSAPCEGCSEAGPGIDPNG